MKYLIGLFLTAVLTVSIQSHRVITIQLQDDANTFLSLQVQQLSRINTSGIYWLVVNNTGNYAYMYGDDPKARRNQDYYKILQHIRKKVR